MYKAWLIHVAILFWIASFTIYGWDGMGRVFLFASIILLVVTVACMVTALGTCRSDPWFRELVDQGRKFNNQAKEGRWNVIYGCGILECVLLAYGGWIVTAFIWGAVLVCMLMFKLECIDMWNQERKLREVSGESDP